jgi:hypothetical protein
MRAISLPKLIDALAGISSGGVFGDEDNSSMNF